MEKRGLEGRQVLVVEDEMTIALVIEEMVLGVGAELVGPVARLDAALRLAREAMIDVAILDINIRGGASYGVADILAERQIPFIFCTGYGDWALEERHRDRPRLSKPFKTDELEDQILQLLTAPPG